ncbi:MAG: Hsp20/alpha crystallin family protein [Planctomycetaceae bacterium]|nr:Hsp20/alpha crystallin family protein [Planctomycetaceae bacterium]
MNQAIATREPRRRRRWMAPAPIAALQEEFGELASTLLADVGEMWPLSRVVPTLDLAETDNAVEVRMDLPGIKAEEIDIHLTENTLTVSGERKEEKEEKGKTYHRVERRQGSFSRTVTLPCCVDDTKVDAHYKDGVLTIKMPKSEEARSRKVKVHT